MRLFSRGLRIVLVILAVVFALGLVLPYFLSVDRYRDLIASAIEQETGRKVTLGKLRARLLPAIGFVIEDFRLGNPRGFPAGNLLVAETVRGSLAWGPLLRREFELRSIELVRPKLLLLEDSRGRTNYEFEEKGKGRAAPSGAASRIAEVGSVDLSDAELTMAAVGGAGDAIVPTLRASKIDARLNDVSFGANRLKDWKADANLAGVRLEVGGLGVPIEFRSGRAELREGKLESKLEAQLGKLARVEGNLRVPNLERGWVTFELSTALLDLDQWAASRPREAAAREAPAVPRAGKSELLAQGRVAAERVRWSPYEAAKLSAEVRVFTDRIEIWPVLMAFYGGTFQASARLDRRQTPLFFSTNVQVRNLDVGRILATSPETRGKVAGTGELTLQLFDSLGKDWKGSLSGTGNFAVRDGHLPGLNLGGTLAQLLRFSSALGPGGTTGSAKGETLFRSIQGDVAIRNERVSSRRIHMDSPDILVDLSGSFGFNGALDYDGQAVLARSSTAGSASPADLLLGVIGGVTKQNVDRLSVPFHVSGTFEKPELRPGRGLPSIQTPPTGEASPAQPPKNKSILDLFRRP